MTQEERNTIAENIYTQELKEFIQYMLSITQTYLNRGFLRYL